MQILWKSALVALILTMSIASGMEPVARLPLWRLTSVTRDDSADFGRLPSVARAREPPAPAAGRLLSRHKRFLVFPEGSTFNAAFCATTKVYVPEDVVIFTEGVAWGASFDLPNNTRVVASAGAGVEPDDLRRRTERSGLYRRLERAADSAGLDGRSCVLRALCEADQLLAPGHSLATELMRVAFAIPTGQIYHREPPEHSQYVSARRYGQSGEDCGVIFGDCPISLITLAASLNPI